LIFGVLTPAEIEQVDGRAIIVKKLKPLPVEAIVRGYIIGSGWKDYQQTGSAKSLPTSCTVCSKSIFSSCCPTAALLEGV
jgi:phosphoribosylaminoimidazole-succinocarboxamide synthase